VKVVVLLPIKNDKKGEGGKIRDEEYRGGKREKEKRPYEQSHR